MRPVGAWLTMPSDVEHSAAGTPHLAAAAEISICRAAAPALRRGIQLDGVE